MQFKKEGIQSYKLPARKCNQMKINTAKVVAFSCTCRQHVSCRTIIIALQAFFFKLHLISLLYVRQEETFTEETERLVGQRGVVDLHSAYQ